MYNDLWEELYRNITNQVETNFIVKSMIDIAKACGKEVVAEFVCDQKTLEILQGYGVDYVQGDFVGPAQPEMSFEFG